MPHGRAFARLLALLTLVLILPNAGTGVFAQEPRQAKPEAIRVPDGYRIEAIAVNLSVPTTAIFDQGDLLIAESGWAQTARPRVLRMKPDGSVSIMVGDGLDGPITGLLMIDGTLYVSHKGKVSAFENGRLRDVLTGLPSDGDHQNNKIVRGGDGKIYMGQGTVTNSGVVGVDSYIFGWLPKNQQVREIPCKDIVLAGQDFETENPLTPAADTTTTGAYQPFGTRSQPAQVIKGDVKCGGSILRFNPDGTGLELVAWGLRNPFGLQFDGQGKLWTTFHGADVRGAAISTTIPTTSSRLRTARGSGGPSSSMDSRLPPIVSSRPASRDLGSCGNSIRRCDGLLPPFRRTAARTAWHSRRGELSVSTATRSSRCLAHSCR